MGYGKAPVAVEISIDVLMGKRPNYYFLAMFFLRYLRNIDTTCPNLLLPLFTLFFHVFVWFLLVIRLWLHRNKDLRLPGTFFFSSPDFIDSTGLFVNAVIKTGVCPGGGGEAIRGNSESTPPPPTTLKVRK